MLILIMRNCRILFLLLMLSALLQSAKASHIIGGSIQMQHVQANEYIVSLNYYRDCSPGSVDFPPGALRVGVYEKGVDTLIMTIDLQIIKTEDLQFMVGNCINLPINCVQKRIYADTLEMNLNKFKSSAGYYISYEQCCRNAGIKNIVNPSTSGIAFYMEFPALLSNNVPFINSSAISSQEQNIFLCRNELFTVDYSYVDADGDSLAYRLVEPLMGNTDEINNNATGISIVQPGPYPPIIWNTGYGMNSNVLDGSPDVSIDEKTGILSVIPQQNGLYVLAIAVDEFRNGLKIGESRNELQYFITSCPQRRPPELTWLNNTQLEIESKGETCFQFEADDLDPDTLDVFLENVSPVLQPYISYTIDSSVKPYQIEVCFNINCNFVEYEDVGFDLICSDNSCPLPLKDTVSLLLKLKGLKDGNPFKSIPNVFTPNADGKNDQFYIIGDLPKECIEEFNIEVYNRWGKKVYESADFSFRWIGDGLDPGVYFYVVKVNGLEKTGHLTLMQ